MNKSNAYLSVLLAGLLAAASVQAQSTSASGSSDLPPKAGEASTQTMGAPNAATTNSPVTEAPVSTKDQIRQGAHGMSGASTTASTPPRAGEASTMVQGNPNADPNDPLRAKSRAEVQYELMMRRAQLDAARAAQMMGHTGYGVEPGTPANAAPGTPPVQRGGTPQ